MSGRGQGGGRGAPNRGGSEARLERRYDTMITEGTARGARRGRTGGEDAWLSVLNEEDETGAVGRDDERRR